MGEIVQNDWSSLLLFEQWNSLVKGTNFFSNCHTNNVPHQNFKSRRWMDKTETASG